MAPTQGLPGLAFLWPYPDLCQHPRQVWVPRPGLVEPCWQQHLPAGFEEECSVGTWQDCGLTRRYGKRRVVDVAMLYSSPKRYLFIYDI